MNERVENSVASLPERAVDLSVVIPVFEEEESVETLYRELSETLRRPGFKYEFIFVDDGSSDSTWDQLVSLASADAAVRIVRLCRNFGQSAAIQAGFDQALGDTVVTMDGDLQNDPKDIPRLMAALGDDFDVVTGWRRDRKDKAISRRLPSIVANRLIGLVTGVRIHDNGCTLKAYRRGVVKRAKLYAEMHRFLVPMLTLSGSRVRELIVNHRSRQFGISKYGLSRIWKVLLDLLTVKMILRFASHPAAWFALLAVPFIASGTIGVSLSILLYLTRDSTGFLLIVPGVTVLSVFAACHLLLLGMFAELVVRTGDFRESAPVLFEVRD